MRDALSSWCVFILPPLRWLCVSVCRGPGLGGVESGKWQDLMEEEEQEED